MYQTICMVVRLEGEIFIYILTSRWTCLWQLCIHMQKSSKATFTIWEINPRTKWACTRRWRTSDIVSPGQTWSKDRHITLPSSKSCVPMLTTEQPIAFAEFKQRLWFSTLSQRFKSSLILSTRSSIVPGAATFISLLHIYLDRKYVCNYMNNILLIWTLLLYDYLYFYCKTSRRHRSSSIRCLLNLILSLKKKTLASFMDLLYGTEAKNIQTEISINLNTLRYRS